MTVRTVIAERRRFARAEPPPRMDINLLQPHGSLAINGVNVSDGGLCLRLQERLEVRSLVRLQLTSEGPTPTRGPRSIECTGRVAWVIQRLDLRPMPPYLFDIGIEFVDPPPLLRQIIAHRSLQPGKARAEMVSAKQWEPATIRGRVYQPRLEQDATHALRWHVVVSVEGTPCFSGHYTSERAAKEAWLRFRREQARRPAGSG